MRVEHAGVLQVNIHEIRHYLLIEATIQPISTSLSLYSWLQFQMKINKIKGADISAKSELNNTKLTNNL